MISKKQEKAARKNIKKAWEKWQGMTNRQHALFQPEGRKRAKPGTTGKGEYYRIVVRPKEEFVTFRIQDVGKPGMIQRLAGKKSSGSWDDQTWLISKSIAHLEGDTLVADSSDAREILDMIGPVIHLKGDIFQVHPRKNIPESEKPTKAQKQARMENIQKAQEARWQGALGGKAKRREK